MKGNEYRRIKKTKHVWSHQNVLAVQKVQYFVNEMIKNDGAVTVNSKTKFSWHQCF